MNRGGKFLDILKDSYRQIFFEQQVPAEPPASTPLPPPMGGIPPLPVAPPPGEVPTDVEKAPDTVDVVTPESEAMLAGLLAKAFFIDLMDETEKFKVKNMQANLTDENTNEIELEVVKRIKSEDPKILDMDEDLFELSPAGARMFLDKIANSGVIEGLTVKPGGGQAYLLNLILTVMLRHFELGEKVKIQEILEQIKEKTTKGPTLEESQSKTVTLLIQCLSKYAKI